MRPQNPTKIIRNVSRRIAEIRIQKGLTQEELAEKAGVSLKYLQRVEAGRENLTIRSLVRLGNLLKVGLDELFRRPRRRTIRRGRPPQAR